MNGTILIYGASGYTGKLIAKAAADAGERLFGSLAPRIEQIEADIAGLVAFRDTPAGTVRITLSDHALRTTVWPKLQPVLRDYPDVKVELHSDNRMRISSKSVSTPGCDSARASTRT